jgi:hypothetical protein
MSAKRIFFIQLAALILLVGLIIGAASAGNIILKKQSDKLVSLKVDKKVLEQQNLRLAQAKKDVEKYSELNQTARAIVPQDKDQAKTVREISTIANNNGIALKSIDFDTSTLGDAKPVAPKAAEGDTTPTATPATPPLSQVKAVSGIPGVYSLDIRVSSAGEVPYESLIGFLEDLEQNRRTANVIKVDFDPSDNGGGIKFVITLSAYIKP